MRSNHERGMVFLDSGGDCIILARYEGDISPVRFPDVHHAFKVDSDKYQEALKFLADQGIDVFLEEDRQNGAVNGPRAYFHDPDGNVLEIIDLTSYLGDAA
jgi:catechol 2,3-dioxygenase-like lactoylglutathione lyase family enzyme